VIIAGLSQLSGSLPYPMIQGMAVILSEPEGEDLTRWLQESGRRKINRASLEQLATKPSTKQEPPKRRWITQPELLFLFALAAVSYLLYYFIEVHLQILALPSIVVFVPA